MDDDDDGDCRTSHVLSMAAQSPNPCGESAAKFHFQRTQSEDNPWKEDFRYMGEVRTVALGGTRARGMMGPCLFFNLVVPSA